MKRKYTKQTKWLLYHRLLKGPSKGLNFKELKLQVPKSLRCYVPDALKLLYDEGILAKTKQRYTLIKSLKH